MNSLNILKIVLVFLLSFTAHQISAQLTNFPLTPEGARAALNEGTRQDIFLFFTDLNRKVRSSSFSDAERKEMLISLYEFKDDSREEVVVSEDEIASNIRFEVVRSMVSLTAYNKIEGKEVEEISPFQPDEIAFWATEEGQKDFFRWFEENYLGDSDQDRSSPRTGSSALDLSNPKNAFLIESTANMSQSSTEKRGSVIWIYLVLGLMILGGIFLLFPKGRKS